MSGQELFDVYDASMVKIGVDTRENVHAKGLWHQTFHCWIVSRPDHEPPRLLLQLRQSTKDTYPGLLDISSAGHLQAGETVEDGVRELREELGLEVVFEDLFYCGLVPEEDRISPVLTDREFNHVFLYSCNKEAADYDFQAEEIAGLFFCEIEDFKRLLLGQTTSIPIEGVVLDENRKEKAAERRMVGLQDLTPISNEYRNRLFDSLDIYFEKIDPPT
ncbi:NUDIX domain-containing protein [Paenibacillus sp. alder61]|uniref:NUDIX domain-containing protein n=1 Tax=Paenibacillus faecis TaxID=862114 RepID=A0A5D0CWX4_9BACL|nr:MULTISPECIES: NUDIX domain-containing protein [Paenibacillus]MCA1295476.1 NUDIX domain-containing protein [Paenibacillus sp. alder61]TYA14456.1 NUDIX domain-containing protein [Paenibacillus faecis]